MGVRIHAHRTRRIAPFCAAGEELSDERCEMGRIEQKLFEDTDRQWRQHRPEKRDRKSTRLNSSHLGISYAVFCLKKKKKKKKKTQCNRYTKKAHTIRGEATK